MLNQAVVVSVVLLGLSGRENSSPPQEKAFTFYSHTSNVSISLRDVSFTLLDFKHSASCHASRVFASGAPRGME